MTSIGAYYFCGDLSSDLEIVILVSTGMGGGQVLSWDEDIQTTSSQVRFCLESGLFSRRRFIATMFFWFGMGS
jgi:hypothetical protein